MTEPALGAESVAISSSTTDAHQAEPPRASIDRAFASLDASTDTPPASETPPDTSPLPHTEVPVRFSAEAKAAWQSAPDSIKAETWRALRELESGLSGYQKDFEPLKPWFDLARQHKTTVHEAMERYTTLDRALLSEDVGVKLKAIQAVFDHAGMAPADYVKHVLARQQEKPQADSHLQDLRRELTDLRHEMGGITSSLAERRRDDSKRELDAFAKDHPRLTDTKFQETFNRLLETGMAEGLAGAYDMADRLNPLPPQPRSEADQTRKGQLSISGAPASGSNPVTRKAPATARESLDRTFASLGLG